jgi:low affinity Fe/Cu permease
MSESGSSVEVPAPRESIFEKVADWVSAAMGRPTNIMVWLVLVVVWTLIFALHIVSANATFLPAWFTGTAFNFPLNLLTTVAELFIGFLVAAASNRSERNLAATLAGIAAQEQAISDVEGRLSEALAANTELTSEVKKLTAAVHAAVVGKDGDDDEA